MKPLLAHLLAGPAIGWLVWRFAPPMDDLEAQMSILDKAYRRVSRRHGGISKGQITDLYGHEVYEEIDCIAFEYFVIWCVGCLVAPMVLLALAALFGKT